ncbi:MULTISPECIES: DJ-1/PfpI family protein [unclassified Devosia]|uniref:DJ-1/PfpI family protein n=1 Tax=unclassified Devosia TaxID=196773 RepID=UPI00145D8517|nr:MULTISPECIES: DJ-1/PfpI family protein [unclassified Devosia]MBJ6987133.1 DJ-1/PfpI family protein [Devosia sp. MC521]QMW62752.1 DJ-1/PfpI family protein [Devosia sp. MC521]
MHPITIILTEGFSDWEIALISGAGRLFFAADIRFVSPNGGNLTSAGGMLVADTGKLDVCSEGVLVVCGGTIWDAPDAPDISPVLLASKAAGATIAAICGGTLPAARAGLLNAIPHTSNGDGYLAALVPAYAGAQHYIAQTKAIAADGVITAAGTAPVSFAAEVFAAAGLPPEAVAQFLAMLGAEHHA